MRKVSKGTFTRQNLIEGLLASMICDDGIDLSMEAVAATENTLIYRRVSDCIYDK